MSTLNANVFFELGIRTALNKPVCVVKDNLTTTVPFDINVINNYTYDHTLKPWVLVDEIPRLESHVRDSLGRSGEENTLWRRFGLTRVGQVPERNARSLDQRLDLLFEEISLLPNKLRDSAPHSTAPTSQVDAGRNTALDDVAIIMEGIPSDYVGSISLDNKTRSMSVVVSERISSEQMDVLARRAARVGWSISLEADSASFADTEAEEV